MDYLKELVARADLGTWETWSTQYRVLAIIVVLVIAYTAIRAIVPTVLRVMRPALFLAIVLIDVWALYPAEVCSIEVLAKLPFFCAR